MSTQRLWGGIVSRQFRLGQRRVDLAMADMVQQHLGSALTTFQLGDQMVQALWRARWDGTAT